MTTRTPAESKVGDKMPDGTIYAGISPDTKQAMYATPADAPTTMLDHYIPIPYHIAAACNPRDQRSRGPAFWM
jgi:hypothetical protein